MADLGSDPGFQTFLRTLTARRDMVEANKQRRIASLMAKRSLDLANIGISEEQGLGKVNDEFEDRGMFRAGGRLEDRADVMQLANADRAAAELALSEGTSEAGRTAATTLADLSIQQANAEMDARNRISDREFQEAAQARAERLAAEQRADWLKEQARLQALYDRQAGLGGGVGGGGGSVSRPPVVSFSSPTRAPTRSIVRTTRTSPGRAPASAGARAISRSTPTRRTPARSGGSSGATYF